MNAEWMIGQCEGRPAPVPLLAVQSFANTIDVEEGTDRLGSAESAAEWLRGAELGSEKLKATPALLKPARELRDLIRRLLAANERGEVDRKAAAALALLASQHKIPLHANDEGRLEPDLTPADTPNQLLAQFLGIIFEAQALETWPRLKLCENPDCQWAFYDASRNRSGSWCRMGECGNRLKNRAYRQRQKRAR